MNEYRQIMRPLPRELAAAWTAQAEARASTAQQLSVAEIGRTIIKRKFPIFSLAAIVFLFVGVFSYLKVPMYEGVARLQIDPNRPSDLNLNEREKLQNRTSIAV